jgi:hypothetical protein
MTATLATIGLVLAVVTLGVCTVVLAWILWRVCYDSRLTRLPIRWTMSRRRADLIARQMRTRVALGEMPAYQACDAYEREVGALYPGFAPFTPPMGEVIAMLFHVEIERHGRETNPPLRRFLDDGLARPW